MWRTPTSEEAGARVETLYTKEGGPAQPGERAYRLQPDGRFVLQSQTIGQQVLMLTEGQSSPHAGDPSDTVNRTARLKALGNGIVPLCALPFAMAIYRMLENENAS